MKIWAWPATLTWGLLYNRICTFQALPKKLLGRDLASGPARSEMKTSTVWTVRDPHWSWGAWGCFPSGVEVEVGGGQPTLGKVGGGEV